MYLVNNIRGISADDERQMMTNGGSPFYNKVAGS